MIERLGTTKVKDWAATTSVEIRTTKLALGVIQQILTFAGSSVHVNVSRLILPTNVTRVQRASSHMIRLIEGKWRRRCLDVSVKIGSRSLHTNTSFPIRPKTV